MEKGFHNIEQFIAFITPGHTASVSYTHLLGIGITAESSEHGTAISLSFHINCLIHDCLLYTSEQALYYARSEHTEKDYSVREMALSEVVHGAIADNKYCLLYTSLCPELYLKIPIVLHLIWIMQKI